MNPLKIALIVDHFLPQIGGVEVHVSDLAKELSSRGHEVQVITAFSNPSPIEGIHIHKIKTSHIPGTNSIWNPNVLKKLTKLFLEEAFDTIHCHNSIFSPLAYGSLYVSQRLRIPTVLTTHSLFSTGSITFFRFLSYLLGIRNWPVIITGVSQESSRRLRRAFPHHDILTLPNGIHTLNWEVNRIPSKFPNITTVMRLHRKKQPQRIIEALPHLNKKLNSGQKPRVSFIGGGPMKTSLKRLAKKLGVSDQVKFLGWLPREEIKNILARSNVFALPSPWETLPITALEACSTGLPVVGMAKSGLRDIVTHGRHGFLSNNHQEFISYMEKILKNQDLGKQLGENAKRDIGRFDWENIIPKNLATYRLAIQKGSLKQRGYG